MERCRFYDANTGEPQIQQQIDRKNAPAFADVYDDLVRAGFCNNTSEIIKASENLASRKMLAGGKGTVEKTYSVYTKVRPCCNGFSNLHPTRIGSDEQDFSQAQSCTQQAKTRRSPDGKNDQQQQRTGQNTPA